MREDSLLTAAQLSREEIEGLLDRAAAFDAGTADARHPGRVLALCFFEPSTRTKMSFETAMKRLGGETVDMGSVDSSSVSKGESLADTVRVIEGYADAIVLRHPSEGSARMAAEFVDVPLVNAGDGAGQHPSQTLLDLYTMRETVGLDGVTVGVMGDLKYGRTVHSLAAALTNFDVEQHFVSPESLRLPPNVRYELREAGGTVHEHRDVGPVLSELDVLYVTRIQRERFPDENEYRAVAGDYRIDAATLDDAKPGLQVMHPLPRVDEIAADVDETEHARYFEQAHNGVPVRMALLDAMLSADDAEADDVAAEHTDRSARNPDFEP
jgi:aspartate carbamoyltransferase catalytic subunit